MERIARTVAKKQAAVCMTGSGRPPRAEEVLERKRNGVPLALASRSGPEAVATTRGLLSAAAREVGPADSLIVARPLRDREP